MIAVLLWTNRCTETLTDSIQRDIYLHLRDTENRLLLVYLDMAVGTTYLLVVWEGGY